jgi:predicted RNase H-like HicB family nuclease
MRVMKFPVTIYQDEEGWYVVECPVIPGCMSQGKTEEEALQNIQEAIQLCLDVRREQGMGSHLCLSCRASPVGKRCGRLRRQVGK